MSENNKSPEVVMAETFANITTPVLEKMAESIKSVIEVNAEAKTAKEEFEAKSKSILERIEAAEQKNAILEAEQLEMKAKKSVNTGVATHVDNFEQLAYQVKSYAVQSLTTQFDGLEQEKRINQSFDYIKSFGARHKNIADKVDMSSIVGELSQKSVSHAITDMSALFNAPFILPALVYARQELPMQRTATTYLSNSKQVLNPSFIGEGEPEWIGLKPTIDPQKATIFSGKKIQAAGLAQYVTISEVVQDAASDNIQQAINILQSFMNENILHKFEDAYSNQGITLGDAGGSIEGVIPGTNKQYAYDFNSKLGSDQVQIGKLAFIKSGNATNPTVESAIQMKKTLPQGIRLQLMGNSTTIDKFKLLKDANQSIIYFNGNGSLIANEVPDRVLGFDLIVNNRMPDNIAVYGDITGSYAITVCFGGYKVFNRPATGGDLFDGLMGKMYATGQIRNYKNIRLFKFEL